MAEMSECERACLKASEMVVSLVAERAIETVGLMAAPQVGWKVVASVSGRAELTAETSECERACLKASEMVVLLVVASVCHCFALFCENGLKRQIEKNSNILPSWSRNQL